MATESETKKIELATLYELRLIIDASEKDDYSKEEILRLIDQIATQKRELRVTLETLGVNVDELRIE